jgi:hypothetical protein
MSYSGTLKKNLPQNIIIQGLPLFTPRLYNNKVEYNTPLVQGLGCIGKTNQHNWETI